MGGAVQKCTPSAGCRLFLPTPQKRVEAAQAGSPYISTITSRFVIRKSVVLAYQQHVSLSLKAKSITRQ